MTDRETLIRLIEGALEHASKQCEELDSCCACPHGERGGCQSAFILDYLISNGVTFAKDTDVPSKWISVEDEKPKRRGHYFITYKFAGSDMRFYGEAFWHDDIPDNGYVQGNHFSNEGVDGMYVTHWMEIQELPEPPRVQGVPNGTDHA